MNNEFRKASDIISSLFSGFDTNGMNQSNSFIKSWKEIVGENIASHSKVIDVDKGVVIVEVDHPGWSQKIHFKKKQILFDLSKNYPDLKIRNLIIRVVNECKTPYTRLTVPVGEGISRMEESSVDVLLPENMNEELKAVLEKLKNSIKKGKPTK